MPTVVDTVIVHYFLLVERFPLLLALLDPPVLIPRVVFDPDEYETTDIAASEIRQNVDYERRLGVARGTTDEDREAALENARRIETLSAHVAQGHVEVVDMTSSEQELFARLRASDPEAELGIKAPLGAGEAAAVAIALERDATLATDDSDALKALGRLHAGHAYERIRRLLIHAAAEGHVTEAEANEIHREMQALGFWDRELPFPE